MRACPRALLISAVQNIFNRLVVWRGVRIYIHTHESSEKTQSFTQAFIFKERIHKETDNSTIYLA